MKRILLYVNIVFLLVKGVIWFTDNQLNANLVQIREQIGESKHRLDSILILKNKIEKQDSLTNFWGQLKEIDSLSISEQNKSKFKLGILDTGMKAVIIDSLGIKMKFLDNLIDSLSPNYNLEFRQQLYEEEQNIKGTLIENLLSLSTKTENQIRLIEIAGSIINILIIVSIIIFIISLLRSQ